MEELMKLNENILESDSDKYYNFKDVRPNKPTTAPNLEQKAANFMTNKIISEKLNNDGNANSVAIKKSGE